MANILLEEVAKELKLVKVVDTSRYWRSQWPFDVAFRQSHTLLTLFETQPDVYLPLLSIGQDHVYYTL